MTRCRDCGTALLPEDQFCPQCGESVNTSFTRCGVCGYPARAGARFCIKCGVPIGHSSALDLHTQSTAVRPAEPPAKAIASTAGTPASVLKSNASESEHVRSAGGEPGIAEKHGGAAARSRLPIAVVVLGFALAVGIYLSLRAAENERASATAARLSGTPSTAAVTGTLGTTKLDAGAFSMKQAFTALYGDYDPNLDGAFWTARGAPAQLEQWNGRQLFIRPLIVRAFQEGGKPRQIVVTNSLDVKNGDVVKQGTGCRTCGSLIGAAVFEKQENEWKLISRHDFMTAAGSWGAPPKISLAFQRGGAIALHFEMRAADQPELEKRRYSIVLKERKAPPDVTRASANNAAQNGPLGQRD
jgi:Double zinc ribbon